jgi:Sulfotransferase family
MTSNSHVDPGPMIQADEHPMTTTLLTGLPRSGTTLACALLNEFPDTLALAEPLALQRDGDRERALSDIESFIRTTRETAVSAGVAISKHDVDGAIPENFVEAPSLTQGRRLRKVVVRHGQIRIEKPLSEAFSLVIKHPAEFSTLADLILPRYPLVALVRHPLAVLAAWQTVDMPINRGRMPMAEAYSPGLAAMLDGIGDRVQRQVALIGWLLGVYSEFPLSQIIRYEDMMADPERQLRRFTPHSRAPVRPIEQYDVASRYAGVDLRHLARELLAICTVAERFYPDFETSLAPHLT